MVNCFQWRWDFAYYLKSQQILSLWMICSLQSVTSGTFHPRVLLLWEGDTPLWKVGSAIPHTWWNCGAASNHRIWLKEADSKRVFFCWYLALKTWVLPSWTVRLAFKPRAGDTVKEQRGVGDKQVGGALPLEISKWWDFLSLPLFFLSASIKLVKKN